MFSHELFDFFADDENDHVDWTFYDEDDQEDDDDNEIFEALSDGDSPCVVLPNPERQQKFNLIVSCMRSLVTMHTGKVTVEMSKDKPYASASVEIPETRGENNGLEEILSIIRHADSVAVNTLPNRHESIHAIVNRMFVVI